MNNSKLVKLINTPEYDINFWNYARDLQHSFSELNKGKIQNIGSYQLPTTSLAKYDKAIVKESIFRQIGTALSLYNTHAKVLAKDCKDIAMFVPEGGEIPIYNAMNDFTEHKIDTCKMCSLIKLDEDFVHDEQLDLEGYLVPRFAKCMGRCESNGFINGTGTGSPVGILHETEGAETGATTSTLTYDDVIKLYLSVKPEYRSKGVWLMNDETALALRILKDADGNYLWRDSDDTILGKKVLFSEFMPNATAGKKPIAFGDFSYYWIFDKSPLSIKLLKEKFAFLDQLGYFANQFIYARLVRSEAVKVIQVNKA